MDKWLKLLPIVAFLAYLTKITIHSATVPDALVLLCLVGYIITNELRLKDKTLLKYDAQIKSLEEKIEGIDTSIKIVQASNNSVKAAIGMRSVTGTKI